MNDEFFIPEGRLAQLRATPAGRNAEGGFDYQRAYAVARLAAMGTAKPVLDRPDYPKRLRYDWADDLDELLDDGSVCFTQCKREEDIGQPANLAQVLLGFAPKWLWLPQEKHDQVRFRLVSCDKRFHHDFNKDTELEKVHKHFTSLLEKPPSNQSDRAIWQTEADSIGHEQLFDAIWQRLDTVYIPKGVVQNHPVEPLLPAERVALDHLTRWYVISSETQKEALTGLRLLIHGNLITFDPADQIEPQLPKGRPRVLEAADVRVELFGKAKEDLPTPFGVVNQTYLATEREVERKRFLFNAPEWHHVVHGADDQLKFIERDQTSALVREIHEYLTEPLQRRTGSLPALFVTGPPGAGKSTLVRRAAVRLIEEGKIVVADPGLGLPDSVPGGIKPYADQLLTLARQGHQVLLVLDDPLFAESEWIDLFKQLKRPPGNLAILAATPDYLYFKYKHLLKSVKVHNFSVKPPSLAENQALAKLYGRALNDDRDLPDDFLVMVAEAAEGIPFPKIMNRLWMTLNGGKDFSSDVSFRDLPWRVRAFWFVCALHRVDEPCPLPLLQEALVLSGGTENLSISEAMEKFGTLGGWKMVRIIQPQNSMLKFVGELTTTAHQKIARGAWDNRRDDGLYGEVNRLLVAATLRVTSAVTYVAMAAGALTKDESNPDSNLADLLIQEWTKAAAEDANLETRNIYSLSTGLFIGGGRELVRRMYPAFLQRVKGSDGWLAALELYYLSGDRMRDRLFPPDINLEALISEADFSIAPKRAS
jgi:hypothetical protein